MINNNRKFDVLKSLINNNYDTPISNFIIKHLEKSCRNKYMSLLDVNDYDWFEK